MASADDDFDYNPFYSDLQDHYSAIFEDAQAKCYVICVPQSSSIRNREFDLEFVEHHILKPSPFFKGHFSTIDKDASGTVIFKDQVFETGEGFEEKRRAKILAEETGYNADSRQFRIVLIDRPLIGKISSTPKSGEPTVDLYSAKLTLSECSEYLHSFKESSHALTVADEKIQVFQNTYMVLKGFIDDAIRRLQHIFTEVCQLYQSSLRLSLAQDQRVVNTISQAVESYILHQTYLKVYPVLCEEHSADDNLLFNKFNQMLDISPQWLGVRQELVCPLPEAVTEIKRIVEFRTPYEKMLCIRRTVDFITETVRAHLMSTKSTSEDDDSLCLTSDDYIPLLVTVLGKARMNNIASEIYYIENCRWSEQSKDNLSFVSLQAAAHYIKGLDVERILKQIRAKEPPSSVDFKEPTAQAASPPAQPLKSRKDRRLERINRMLDRTTRELQTMQVDIGRSPDAPISGLMSESVDVNPQRPFPSRRSQQQGDPHLGAFLSSLLDNQLPSCYGKQT